jgi:hypothetical protein
MRGKVVARFVEKRPIAGMVRGTLERVLGAVTVQVVKTEITPQLAPADRLREAETVPLHPTGRLHTLQ